VNGSGLGSPRSEGQGQEGQGGPKSRVNRFRLPDPRYLVPEMTDEERFAANQRIFAAAAQRSSDAQPQKSRSDFRFFRFWTGSDAG
jgi:hypothetical protein